MCTSEICHDDDDDGDNTVDDDYDNDESNGGKKKIKNPYSYLKQSTHEAHNKEFAVWRLWQLQMHIEKFFR